MDSPKRELLENISYEWQKHVIAWSPFSYTRHQFVNHLRFLRKDGHVTYHLT